MHSLISIEPHASIAVGWTPKTFLWLKVMQVVWVTCVTAASLETCAFDIDVQQT